MRFENPYGVTLDMRGYLDLLFLKTGVIYSCYFNPHKTLKEFERVPNNASFHEALSISGTGFAKLEYSSPCHLHYFLPLTSLQGYSMVERSSLEYYTNLYRVLFFDSKVSFIDKKGAIFKETRTDGGSQFLNIAIKSVI